MKIAKLFTNGRSQAVRLPKNCRFKKGEREVFVQKVEGMVMLISKKNPWSSLVHSLDQFTDDFMADRRKNLPLQKRKGF